MLDHCGISEISLRHGEALTIEGDFKTMSVSQQYIQYIGHFAIYPGTSDSILNTNASGRVFITNHTNYIRHLECIWRLKEPEGTRIRVKVVDFTGRGTVLKIGNGLDPTTNVPVLVLDDASGVIPLPIEMPSLDSGMWVTLKSVNRYGFLQNLRLVFTTYHITGKTCKLQIIITWK